MTKYPIPEADFKLFLTSKEFAALKKSNFSKWGSKEHWKSEVIRRGSGPRNELDMVVQNLKTQKGDGSFAPQRSASKNPKPKKKKPKPPSKKSVNSPKSKILPPGSKLSPKTSPALSSSSARQQGHRTPTPQNSVSRSRSKSPKRRQNSRSQNGSGSKKTRSRSQSRPSQQASQSQNSQHVNKSSSKSKSRSRSPNRGNVSISKIDPSSDLQFKAGIGWVNDKGRRIDFSGATKADGSQAKLWLSHLNKKTGVKKQSPLSMEEIKSLRFHGIGQSQLTYNKRFRRPKQDDLDDYQAPQRTKQPYWETRPNDCKKNGNYRLDQVRLWEQIDIDFGKIPVLPLQNRDKALKRLKKYDSLPIDNAPPVEVLILRHQVAMLSTAISCFEKLLQKMAIDAKNEEILASVSIGRRICANTMEPLYKHLSELDQLLYQSKRDSKAFIDKQTRLCKSVLQDIWDFPIFESDSTDKDIESPPKMYLNAGKPLKVQNFEKKCLAACKPAKKKPPTSPKRTKNRGAKRRSNTAPPKKKKPKLQNKKKKSWYCEKCKVYHGRKEDYKCPKK